MFGKFKVSLYIYMKASHMLNLLNCICIILVSVLIATTVWVSHFSWCCYCKTMHFFYSLNMNMLTGYWYIDLEPDVFGSKISDPNLVLEILIN